MPRGDRTGPNGMGSMTGRAAGFCAGFGNPGYANQLGFGRGFGGRGRSFWGRGFGGGGWGWQNPLFGWPGFGNLPENQRTDPQTERETLKRQAEMLQSQMAEVQKRLNEMDAAGKED